MLAKHQICTRSVLSVIDAYMHQSLEVKSKVKRTACSTELQKKRNGATQYSFSRDCKQIIQFIIKVARFILHESKGGNP